MIALYLRGRIGNQLFMYAMAEAIRQKRNRNEQIIIYDKNVVEDWHWEDSLPNYDLNNVRYIHKYEELPVTFKKKLRIVEFLNKFLKRLSYTKRFNAEKILKYPFKCAGIICCENGHIEIPTPTTRDVLIYGYFQSEDYFKEYKDAIINQYAQEIDCISQYKDMISNLHNRNSVCISVKVEDNAGNSNFNVCGKDYYLQAIKEIENNVENPLFFICSDNVQYVLDNLIDVSKYEYYCQPSDLPVHKSLAIMSLCKYFIINNSTYSWWAQYLCSRNEKEVYAPNRWMRIEMPVDIYDIKWKLIDVTNYISTSNN